MIADHGDGTSSSVATESEEPLQRTDPQLTRYALVRALARLWRQTGVHPAVEFFAYIDEMPRSKVTEVWQREHQRQQNLEVAYEKQRKIAEAADLEAERRERAQRAAEREASLR